MVKTSRGRNPDGRKDKGRSSAYLDVSSSTRARMRAVRTKNSAPELVVRRTLHSLGFRFRIHRSDLPGTPDIVLPRYRTVVMVHGCFWHGHVNCLRSALPRKNTSLWTKKITANRERDQRVINKLEALGWQTVVIWECETRDRCQLRELLTRTFRS